MLKRTGSFGPFWGCGQFHAAGRRRKEQNRAAPADNAARLPLELRFTIVGISIGQDLGGCLWPATESPGPLEARTRQGRRRNRRPPRYPASARRFGCSPASKESPPELRPRRPRPSPAWRFGAGAHREYDAGRSRVLEAAGEGTKMADHVSPTFRPAFPSSAIISERSSPSRVRYAAPNNGAPLTAPGRSGQHF